MSGFNIGWFDTGLFNHDIDYLTKRLRRAVRPKHKAWPLAVSTIHAQGGFDTGVSYCIVTGAVPIHIDPVPPGRSDGGLWNFVLETANRPAILYADATEVNEIPIVQGQTDPREKLMPFMLGAVELAPAMAFHLDISTSFHGITGLPLPGRSMDVSHAPEAVIVQVGGFRPDQLGAAVEHARELVHLDRPFWDKRL